MSSAPLDEVWGREPEGSEEPVVSARVQKMELNDMDRMRMEIMERVSTLLICVMGALTIVLIHVERLRREVRLLREGILRPMR